MTQKDKALLIKQATRLTTLGVQLEAARAKLRRLVAQGILYNDPKMLKALTDFEKLDSEWTLLEQVHLATRRQMGIPDTD
jgi:hypothetical protein